MENKEYPTYVFEERMESIKKNLRNYCNDTLDLHRKSTSLLFNFDEETWSTWLIMFKSC